MPVQVSASQNKYANNNNSLCNVIHISSGYSFPLIRRIAFQLRVNLSVYVSIIKDLLDKQDFPPRFNPREDQISGLGVLGEGGRGKGGGVYIMRLETVAMHDSESFRSAINAPRVLREIGQKEFKSLKDLSSHGNK